MPHPDTTPTETVTDATDLLQVPPMTRLNLGAAVLFLEHGIKCDDGMTPRSAFDALALLRAALDGEVPGREERLREKLIEIRDETSLVLHEEGDAFETCVVIDQLASGALRASSESPRGEGQ